MDRPTLQGAPDLKLLNSCKPTQVGRAPKLQAPTLEIPRWVAMAVAMMIGMQVAILVLLVVRR